MTAMSLTTSFGTRVIIRDPVVTDHAWGPVVKGMGLAEDSLIEEEVHVRLRTATNVQWWPDYEQAKENAHV